jgi:hypothetical protein
VYYFKTCKRKIVVKKLVLFLAVSLLGVALPSQAFIAKQTLALVVDQIAEYEALSDHDKADLREQLLVDPENCLSYSKDGDNAKFGVGIKGLQIIKKFTKKRNNPLFGEWLHEAIFYDQAKEVKFLVDELSADVNSIDNVRDCALSAALNKPYECGKPYGQGFAIARFLLERGANTEWMGSPEFANGCTPLGYIGTQVGNSPYDWRWPVQFLLEHGACFDVVNARGESFDHMLEVGLEGRKKKLSVRNNITQNKIQKYLGDGRGAIDSVLALPAVAERIAERQERPEVMPFLQQQQGVVDHVFEYMYEHMAQKYKKREEKKDATHDGEIAQELPHVLKTVSAFLPAWQLQESDPAYGLIRLDPVELIGEYVCQQDAQHEKDGQTQDGVSESASE